MKRLVLLALIFSAWSAYGWQFKSLTGQYLVAGASVIDPPENEPKNTHLHFVLAGQAAKDLYDTIKSTPKTDSCGSKGDLVKSVGEMLCKRSAGGKEFQCWFAIDIANQKITSAAAC
jgi:hypothetical protein